MDKKVALHESSIAYLDLLKKIGFAEGSASFNVKGYGQMKQFFFQKMGHFYSIWMDW